MADVSIIVRAYNEAGPLRRLLLRLRDQEFEGEIELIVVDNGSRDDTAAVAREYGAVVVRLRQAEFSYPRSLNVGIAQASAPIVICLVAHAYPESRHWVMAAYRHFADPRVAGVFSFTKPHLDASMWDRLVLWPGWTWGRLWGAGPVRIVMPGTFGATNLAMRRSYWLAHPFDEAYGAGGEDTAWATWALAQGYRIIRDPAFAVRHSHYLRTLVQARQQVAVWAGTRKPHRFDPMELSFRQKR